MRALHSFRQALPPTTPSAVYFSMNVPLLLLLAAVFIGGDRLVLAEFRLFALLDILVVVVDLARRNC